MIAGGLGAGGQPDPGVRGRFDFVCGRNLEVQAGLYGEATMLAGDFLGDPGDFKSPQGSWRFRSRKSYWLLALENGAHFHPMSTYAWREHHETAVALALTAAAAQGLASLQAFEKAIHESAFADHFLQDSFCSGHMGFNRIASSAAASKSFHDAWNVRGRLVTDRAGRRWVTFGDGLLDNKENEDGRRHVLDASTLSIHSVLRAFVRGERSPQDELSVWQALPYTIEAPEIPVSVIEIVTFDGTKDETKADRQLWPLLGLMKPAQKDLVGHAGVWSAAPFTDADEPIIAAVAGLDLAVPFVPAQSYLGIGGTLREPGGGHSAVVDTGILAPIELTSDGLFSHEANLTVSWIFRSGLQVIGHLEYQLNIELGTFLFSLRAGLSEFLRPETRTGWFGGLSIGSTFRAAGGGPL